jgi:hypothetical protein
MTYLACHIIHHALSPLSLTCQCRLEDACTPPSLLSPDSCAFNIRRGVRTQLCSHRYFGDRRCVSCIGRASLAVENLLKFLYNRSRVFVQAPSVL